MDKKIIDWCKSILLSHMLTPRLLMAITRENEKMQDLGYASRHFGEGMSTYDFLDRMLELNLRKRNIYELYVNVTEILKDMDKDERYILEERFFGRKGMDEILPKVNIRTAYRRYNTALEHFARALMEYGYDLDYLDTKFGHDRVIGQIHRAVVGRNIVFKREPKPHKKRSHRVLIKESDTPTMTSLSPAIRELVEERDQVVLVV